MITNKPILFQPWKARAILEWDFLKNGPMQTRRFSGLEGVNEYKGRLHGADSALGPVGYRGLEISDYYIHPKQKGHFRRFPGHWHWFLGVSTREIFRGESVPEINPIPCKCPYGGAGDTLWGRETFWQGSIEKKNEYGLFSDAWTGDRQYFEERQAPGYLKDDIWGPFMVKRPSIFMPKWASRLSLKILSVRAEVVNTISEEDAWREGVFFTPAMGGLGYRDEFLKVFEEMHGSGSLNKWAWVIEFVRIDGDKADER